MGLYYQVRLDRGRMAIGHNVSRVNRISTHTRLPADLIMKVQSVDQLFQEANEGGAHGGKSPRDQVQRPPIPCTVTSRHVREWTCCAGDSFSAGLLGLAIAVYVFHLWHLREFDDCPLLT